MVMGNYGEVDIMTGLPLSGPVRDDGRQRKAVSTYEDTTIRSHELSMALAATDGAVIKIVLDQLTTRIRQMVTEDVQCQTLIKVLGQLKFEMDVAPINAASIVRQVMGDMADRYIKDSAR